VKSLIIAAAFAAVASYGVNCAAETVRPFQGNLILARSGAQSTYLWDATDYVTQLVSDNDVGAAGMRDLQATAVRALAGKVRNSKSKTILLSVMYTKTGAVSPVYGTATFAGVEKVLTLTARGIEIRKNGLEDAEMLLVGRAPRGIKIIITGVLPPTR